MGIIKFLWEDLKSDVAFIKKLIKGDVNIESRLNELKQFSIVSLLHEYWIWYLLLVLAFFVGWMLASQYYQGVCNQFIYDNYIKVGRGVGIVL